MIELEIDTDLQRSMTSNAVPLSFHATFQPVCEKLKKWVARFPLSVDNLIFNDLTILYLIASKKFLDHRDETHLFRLVLSMHLMQKQLLRASTFSPHLRHLEIRWIPTDLLFPFANNPVLGCLIGFNVMDRYEMFDEENILLALQKYLPQLRLVKESSYCHNTQYKGLKIFYFEIEKKSGASFSLLERSLLKNNLEEKVKKSIQPLSPTIFMGVNDEEVYKNILVLSQEIHSLHDLPQAYITLDQQTGKEIVFRITLVHISPFHRFSLKERFFECTFVSQRTLTVRHLENHPIEAHIFRLHLPRDPSLLRADGSLDFYSARQRIVSLLNKAIGDFRDFNGGILIKQQELLDDFKGSFPEIAQLDLELLETFFYALNPLEKQVVLPKDVLSTLFGYFLENRGEKLAKDSFYTLKTYQIDDKIYFIVHGVDSSLTSTILSIIQEPQFTFLDMAYNTIETKEGIFFCGVILEQDNAITEEMMQALQEKLQSWHKKMQDRQVLKIALEYSQVSLDPRIGGETNSGNILRLLFEGLTRFSQNGKVENGIAEFIEISSNLKEYTFKLRPAMWNDGSAVTAYDFEYAWKKVLSPDFKTSFAYFFYPIKNAKEAKNGTVPLDDVGIKVLNDRTLKVELVHPTPYFLEWTAHPIYSPIHRIIDQQHPQWPYECERNYLCNGPFQLKINQPNQGYQLVKNAYYWDINNISLDQITFTHMNPAQGLHAFQKGEVDWVGSPFGGWHSFYTIRKEDNLLTFPNSLVCWCELNTQQFPFHNRKMRQAFAYAIRRTQILTQSFLPLNPAYSPLLPHFREHRKSLFPDYDPEVALTLFNEALEEMRVKSEEVFPLQLLFQEKGISEYTSLCLKQQLKECFNIECELVPLPWNSAFQRLNEGQFHMCLMHWTSWVDDPTYTLNAFRFAKQQLNFTRWENQEYQKLLDLSEQEINPFQRSSLLVKAEEILCDEMPVIPLFYQPYQALVQKTINVSYRPPCGPFNIAKISRKRKEA